MSVQAGARETITLRARSIEVDILPAGASVRAVRFASLPFSPVVGAADAGLYGPANRAFLGATIGRVANRIAGARFSQDGRTVDLQPNEGRHQLHGGPSGFWARTWTVEDRSASAVALSLVSPDGEGGYRGQAAVRAVFAAEDGGSLRIRYEGRLDTEGPLNLTPHLYFNLAGQGSARDHRLTVAANAYLPVDGDLIPTGEVRSVAGGPFNFRQGRRIDAGPAMLDHNFCLDGGRTQTPRAVATLVSQDSRLGVEIATTEPGLQVYDGIGFDGSIEGLGGRGIAAYEAVAIEPQGWPDAPNRPAFPSVFLAPGVLYRHTSVYRFFEV